MGIAVVVITLFVRALSVLLQVFLWSMRSYTLIRKLEGHQSSVVSCDFSPDSALLVTASYDTSVIMWDPYTGERLRSLQ